LLGINFSLVIGIIAGFMNMISYPGHFADLFLVLVVVGVIQFQTAAIAVKIIVLYAVIQF
jgi:predicted PurR-regulated permease PerM